MALQVGKIPNALLAQLLARVPIQDPRVVVGPGVGIDAAVIELGDRLLVAKTDPITFATDLIGWYAVNVNANDVAALGAVPRWFLATLLLPPGAAEDLLHSIFDQIQRACAALQVSLVGGHTEVTYGLARPLLVGCMLGETTRRQLVTAAGARPGDDLVLSKGLAVEGTAVLAREAREELEGSGLPAEAVARAADFLFDPGISVVPEARLACESVDVHAMHDPTEGGLATGLYEMATAAGVGILVDEDRIPVLPETALVCRQLGLAPLGLLASGSLIMAVPPAETARLHAALAQAHIAAATIGRVTPAAEGVKMRTVEGEVVDLPQFARDEVARYLDESGS